MRSGDPGETTPNLIAIDSNGNKFIYGQADTDFFININNQNNPGPLQGLISENNSLNRASFLIKVDKDDKIIYALKHENLKLTVGLANHDGPQAHIHDMKVDHEGNLYFVGTVLGNAMFPVQLSFDSENPHTVTLEESARRHLAFYKINGTTGQVIWSHVKLLEPIVSSHWSVPEGYTTEEIKLKGMRIAVGGNNTDGHIVGIGGTIKGMVDIDSVDGINTSDDIHGGSNYFFVTYNSDGTWIDSVSGGDSFTKTKVFGDLAIDSSKNIFYTYEDESDDRIVFAKDPADGSAIVGYFHSFPEDQVIRAHDIEISDTYVYYNYHYEINSLSSHFIVNRRDKDDLSDPTLKNMVIASSSSNLDPDFFRTNMQIAPNGKLFMQIQVNGPIKYSIDQGSNYTDIESDGISSIADQMYLFEFSSTSFDIEKSFPFGDDGAAAFAKNFGITPENKTVIGLRGASESFQLPAFKTNMEYENTGEWPNMYWMEF